MYLSVWLQVARADYVTMDVNSLLILGSVTIIILLVLQHHFRVEDTML